MKKIILSLVIVLLLCTITGCNYSAEAIDNLTVDKNPIKGMDGELVVEEAVVELTEEEKFALLTIEEKIEHMADQLRNQEISLPAYMALFGEYTNEEYELIMLEINQVSDWYDFDEDGLADYMEMFRNFTDPENPDTDGDGVLDGDWFERKEYTYTVEVEARFLKPYDLDFLENHYQQDMFIIEETDDYLDALILIFPYDKLNETVVGNPNWLEDNAELMNEIQPGRTTNWDDDFRNELIEIIEGNGVYREEHTDLSYFINVVNLLETNYVSYDNMIEVTDELAYMNQIHMMDWFTTFDEEGNAIMNNDAFNSNDQKSKFIKEMDEVIKVLEVNTESEWDYDRIFNTTTAKGMLEEKFHGSCSSTSTFYASVFQALGIPTKIVPIQSVITDTTWHIQNYDGEFKEHKPIMDAVIDGFENEKMKKHFTDLVYENKLGGSSHITNYVYLGGRWINVDISGGFVFNRPPLQGRNGDMLSFYKTADYDFSYTLEEIGENYFNPNVNFFNKMNTSDNFPNSPENSIGNTYLNFLYKNYGITDQYGEHITGDTLKFINNFENSKYQKNMVRWYPEFRKIN